MASHAELLHQVVDCRTKTVMTIIMQQYGPLAQHLRTKISPIVSCHQAKLTNALMIAFGNWSLDELARYRELQEKQILNSSPDQEQAMQALAASDLGKKKQLVDQQIQPIAVSIAIAVQNYLTH